MNDAPQGLGLFCCAGGVDVGYARAGLDMTGVDIVDRPRYPHRFVRADALEYLDRIITTGEIERFDYIHAPPPCQAGCALTAGTNRSKGWGGVHTDLVPATLELLARSGLPSTVEQPNGKARIRKDISLCGEYFGLEVLRHRNFQTDGWSAGPDRWPAPGHPRHRGRVRGYRHGENHPDGIYLAAYGNGGGKATVPEMQRAMGIDWTDVREELTEALPPAYGEWIGRAFLAWRKENRS